MPTQKYCSLKTITVAKEQIVIQTMEKQEPWAKYPVKIIDGTTSVTVPIYCQKFRPTESQQWQLQASATFARELGADEDTRRAFIMG